MTTNSYPMTRALKLIEIARSKRSTRLNLERLRGIRKVFPDIASLQSLQTLSLNSCWLDETESMPPQYRFEILLQLKNLRSLDLRGNFPPHEFLDKLGDMQHLKVLDLNYLKTFPIGITKSHSLEVFSCWDDGDGMDLIPFEFSNLKTLKHLSLYKYTGDLQQLFSILSRLPNLCYLRLQHFQKSLPDNIGDLSHLETLDLTQCEYLESLPDRISGLTNLQHLKLKIHSNCVWGSPEMGHSALKELPESISELRNLKVLDLSGQTLLHSLPKGFEKLENLSDIWIGRTGLKQSMFYNKRQQMVAHTWYDDY